MDKATCFDLSDSALPQPSGVHERVVANDEVVGEDSVAAGAEAESGAFNYDVDEAVTRIEAVLRSESFQLEFSNQLSMRGYQYIAGTSCGSGSSSTLSSGFLPNEEVPAPSPPPFGVVVAPARSIQPIVDILRAAGLQRPAPLARPPPNSQIKMPPSSSAILTTARRRSANVTPYNGPLPVESIAVGGVETGAVSALDAVIGGRRRGSCMLQSSLPSPGTKLLAVHVVGGRGDEENDSRLTPALLKAVADAGGVAYIAGVRVQDRCCQDPAVFAATASLSGGGTTVTNTLPNCHPQKEQQPQKSCRASRQFTFIELFAGIGGFRVGLERAGGRCVFASELTTEARVAYTANYPTSTVLFEDAIDYRRFVVADDAAASPVGDGSAPSSQSTRPPEVCILAGDMTELPDDQFPPHDVLTAGFPCQSFCKAGNNQGLDDRRGALFFEVVRVLRARRPKGFLLENVDNLLVLDGGVPAATVLSHLSACGYRVAFRVINANTAVPQNRRRVYFVGCRVDHGAADQSNNTSDDAYCGPWHRWNSFEWPSALIHPPSSSAAVPPLRAFLDSAVVASSASGVNVQKAAASTQKGNLSPVGSKREREENDDKVTHTVAFDEAHHLRTSTMRFESSVGPAAHTLLLTPAQWRGVCARGGGVGPRTANLDGTARTLISSYKTPSMYSEFVLVSEDSAAGRLAATGGDGAASTATAEEGGESRTVVPCRFYSLSECKRIMGFPPQHIVCTPSVVPAVGYRLLGNAVCPPVVGPIAKSLVARL